MIKWSLLVDKNTFLNLPYFISLIKRYKWGNLLLILLVTSMLWTRYINQDTVYLRELSFVAAENDAPKKQDLDLFLGSSTKKVSLSDIRGMAKSWEFIDKLTSKMMSHPLFSELIFMGSGPKRLKAQKIIDQCQNNIECVHNKLLKILPMHYKIVKNTTTPGFTLRVHAFEEQTSRVLEKGISKLLIKKRYENLSKNTFVKTRFLKEMIKEKKEKLGTSNVDKLKGEIKLISSSLFDAEKSTREVQFMRNKEKAKLFEIELKLKYLEKDENIKVRSKDRVKLEKLRKLERNIIKLNENIELLRLNNDSGENNVIIHTLLRKVTSVKREMNSLGIIKKGINTFEIAQKNRNEVVPRLTIEKNVAQENVKKLENEIDVLTRTRDELLSAKNKLIIELEEIKPEIEILVQIQKQYSANIVLNSTIISDFEFEDFRPESKFLKTHSLKKTLLLNFGISTFLILLFTLFRFLIDPRVFTKKEIEVVCTGLTVLGESPKIAV